jgi:hypothetical protein
LLIMQSDKCPKPEFSRDALKAQLRALPQPPVPAHLEALLLATVPTAKPIPRRRWAARAIVFGVASAVCVMGVLAWRQDLRDNPRRITVPGQRDQDIRQPVIETTGIAAWRQDARLLDEDKLPAFMWPIDESAIPRASSPIPADLLD